MLFVQYRGGERLNDPLGGQVQAADWEGGYGMPGATMYGFTTGPASGRQVSLASGPRFRGIQSLLVQEPVFTATGFHANRYDALTSRSSPEGANPGCRATGIHPPSRPGPPGRRLE